MGKKLWIVSDVSCWYRILELVQGNVSLYSPHPVPVWPSDLFLAFAGDSINRGIQTCSVLNLRMTLY